jgi:hypothetical protein
MPPPLLLPPLTKRLATQQANACTKTTTVRTTFSRSPRRAGTSRPGRAQYLLRLFRPLLEELHYTTFPFLSFHFFFYFSTVYHDKMVYDWNEH